MLRKVLGLLVVGCRCPLFAQGNQGHRRVQKEHQNSGLQAATGVMKFEIGEATHQETIAGLAPALLDGRIPLEFPRLATVWVERAVPLPTHRMFEPPDWRLILVLSLLAQD
jgi:hypothetical protein